MSREGVSAFEKDSIAKNTSRMESNREAIDFSKLVHGIQEMRESLDGNFDSLKSLLAQNQEEILSKILSSNSQAMTILAFEMEIVVLRSRM